MMAQNIIYTAADNCQFFYTTNQDLAQDIYVWVVRMTGWPLYWEDGWLRAIPGRPSWVNCDNSKKPWNSNARGGVWVAIVEYLRSVHPDREVNKLARFLPNEWPNDKKLLYISAVLTAPGASGSVPSSSDE